MNRTATTLISIGVSVLLIAFGIWFLWGNTGWYMPEHGGWMMGYNAMMGGGAGIVMILFWIFLIAAFVLLIMAAVSKANTVRDQRDGCERPTEILKQRYARGEIDRSEYEQKLRDLLV